MDNSNKQPVAFVAGGGKSAVLSNTASSITVQAGRTYMLKATGAGACVRFGGTASQADGGFDFMVPTDGFTTVRATSNTLSCIEAIAAGSGKLYVAEIDIANSG